MEYAPMGMARTFGSAGVDLVHMKREGGNAFGEEVIKQEGSQ